jgi:uncharacterized protein YaiE (UPF0345 family)
MLTVNSYFDDNVKSIAFQGEQLPATVGVISQGNYTFDTDKNEVLTIVSGSLNVQLPETKEWVTYVAGESFEIAAKKQFHVSTTIDTAYLCTYSD